MWNCGFSQCRSDCNSYSYTHSPAAMCTRQLPIFQCQNVEEELTLPGIGAGESEAFVPIFRKHSWEKNTGDVKFWSILRGTESSEKEIIKQYEKASKSNDTKFYDMKEDSARTEEVVPVGFDRIKTDPKMSGDFVPEKDRSLWDDEETQEKRSDRIGDCEFEIPQRMRKTYSAESINLPSSHKTESKDMNQKQFHDDNRYHECNHSNTSNNRMRASFLPHPRNQTKFQSVLPHLRFQNSCPEANLTCRGASHIRAGRCSSPSDYPAQDIPVKDSTDDKCNCHLSQHLISSHSPVSKREGHPRLSSPCLHHHTRETADRTMHTGQYYQVDRNLPLRFQYPAMIKGYDPRPDTCRWLTTNQDYGMHPPTVHHVPVVYHCRSWKFWENLLLRGMYRDSELTTRLSKDDLFRNT